MTSVPVALVDLLGSPEGEAEPLPGATTQHTVRLRFGGRDCVVRFPAAGLDFAAECEATAGAAALGVGPEVLASLEDPACLVTAFLPGAPLTADDLGCPELIAEVAVALSALHDGPPLGSVASPFATVERGGAGVFGDMREIVRRTAQALDPAHPEHAPVPCHNALRPAKLIRDGERVKLVDWTYAGMGNRYFDLGTLSHSAGLTEAGDAWLLECYWGEAPDRRQLASLRLMRNLAELLEGLRGDRHSLERARLAIDDPRLGVWLEDARGQ